MIDFVALAATAALAHGVEVDPNDVYGRWYNQDKTGIVEVYDCGDATPCSRLVWRASDAPREGRGAPPELGTEMFSGFSASPDGWVDGEMSMGGRTMAVRSLTRVSEDSLEMQACMNRMMCRTMTWTNAGDDHTDS